MKVEEKKVEQIGNFIIREGYDGVFKYFRVSSVMPMIEFTFFGATFAFDQIERYLDKPCDDGVHALELLFGTMFYTCTNPDIDLIKHIVVHINNIYKNVELTEEEEGALEEAKRSYHTDEYLKTRKIGKDGQK